MAVTFLSESLFFCVFFFFVCVCICVCVAKTITFWLFGFSFCSVHRSIFLWTWYFLLFPFIWLWIICSSTFLFYFFVIFNIFVHRPVKDGMLCVYRRNDKKSLQTWILKRNPTWSRKRIGASFQLSKQNRTFFVFLKSWDLKTRVSYDVEMQCLYRTMSLSRLLQEFRPIK